MKHCTRLKSGAMTAALLTRRALLALAGSGTMLGGFCREVHLSEETGLLGFFTKRGGVMHDDGDTPAFRAYDVATGQLRYEIHFTNGRMQLDA